MSYDFSARSELRLLAEIHRVLVAAGQPLGIDCFLMGAAARDLMLKCAYGISVPRATDDLDFAVMVRDWDQFAALREGLLATGRFEQRQGSVANRMMHSAGVPLDLVPFGGVERPDRTIAWPGSDGVVFDCFGVNEAFEAAVEVILPGDARLFVAPIPALAILKVAAWHDRKRTHPGRDAPDLLLFARSYMDCDNLERAMAVHPDLLEARDFDYVEAGARLLGRDMKLLAGEGSERLVAILRPEADPEGPLLLAHQSGMEIERARRLVEVMGEDLEA